MDNASTANNVKKIVAQGYDKIAHQYARLEEEIIWPRMKWLQKILAQLEPGSSVLDLGCGSGDPADIEISKQHHVTGVDISQAQIELARKNVPDGEFIHMDAGSVDFSPASFDAVVSFYTLEHIPRREHQVILQRIYRWLKPNAYLLISIKAGEYEDKTGEWLGVPMFFSSYDPEMIKGLVIEAGFELVESAIEIQLEDNHEVPYLWIMGRK